MNKPDIEALRGSSFGHIYFDEYATLDKKTMKALQKIEIPNWSGGIDFGFEQDYKCKFKKEKKMGKATHQDIQEALEAFAEALGLDYSPFREELDGGTVDEKFLPKQDDLSAELTKETKTVQSTENSWHEIYERYYGGFGYKRKTTQEATILGKINAIAEHLGIDFEVQPERVVTTPVRVKAVKRTVKKKTPVKAVKKGKK